jgi:VCBS repeat-containing protein
MASIENRGKTAREAVLTYCTFWTQGTYLDCWPKPNEPNPNATAEEKKAACLTASRELMAMLRHEVPEQDDTASVSEPMREPPALLTGDLGSDSEPEIMAGSFLGRYGVLDINTAGHWTYRAGETGLREIKENEPVWFRHYDPFFVTREDGSVQTLTITLCRRRNNEVKKTIAFPIVGNRVPAETFGENNEPDLRLATERDLARKLSDPDQFEGPAPVPLWVEGRPGEGMQPREVTQDELRHVRLYQERDDEWELRGGGLKFVELLFFNAAERLPVDETKGSDNAADPGPDPYKTGLVGRPAIKYLILEQFQERVEQGTFELKLVDEGEALYNWARVEHPKGARAHPPAIRSMIRDEHRKAKHALQNKTVHKKA